MQLQYISDHKGNTISVVIPIQDWEILKRKYKEIEDELDYAEPTKAEIKANIRKGLDELQQIDEGKLTTRPAKEFLKKFYNFRPENHV
jgi:hypothetical protein